MARRQSAQDVAAARKRQAARKKKSTKPPGLIQRERELTSARRELSTRKGTGVATGPQLRRAQAAVDRAKRNLERQRTSARRTGRPTGG